MATRSLTNDRSATGPSGGLREEDYRTFCAALESTQRGRDFLFEYARRNRNADTEMLLDSLDRIEAMMRAEGKAHDRLRDELRVLLIAIRLARPDINSATALTQAARLVDLLDLMERRIDAMVENKDLQPIVEEPLQNFAFAPAALSVVPRPDEPELPIPSVTAMQPPSIALVQEPARLVIKPLPMVQETPQQELPKQEAPPQELVMQELVGQELVVQEFATQEVAKQTLAKPPSKPQSKPAAEPYEIWEPVAAAPEAPAPDKWLPDFGDEPQIIHTKPVTAAAFMPEVTFISAPAWPVVAETKAETAVVEVAVNTVVTAAAESIPAAKAVPPRNDPLAAIMSLSEAERIALFT